MTEQLNVILVPHTHWDREWYQTFQQFRVRLVKTVDRLLDILEQDTAFSHFMLDGQTIVLDDYLEVRPEHTERLRRLIRSGRILIGPWYLQPDEFLVSGEALIRNLQLGEERASEFGGLMRVGYVPDCFGHIAQLPQILQGCGIETAVFWRGVGADAQKSEFYWEAPDGSSVLVIHLADPLGYSNARQMPLKPEEFATRVELLCSNILARATTDTLLFMNGSDHLEAQAGLPATIAAANQLLARIKPGHKTILAHLDHNSHKQNGPDRSYDSIQVRIGTLPEYIAHVREQNSSLETLHGEMRSSQYAHLLPAVLSTRMWIKQQNAATEHLLEKWVEPLTAWSAILGSDYPRGLVSMAWKYLLQNHPHDSICGCSIDQVHRENSIRFSQSQQICESIIAQAMQEIATHVDTRPPLPTTHPSQAPVPIVVFNPAPGPRNEAVQVQVQLPGSLYNATIVDERGYQVPYRIVNRWRQEIGSMPFARELMANAILLAGVTTPAQLIQLAHSMVMSALGQSEQTHVISHIYIEGLSDSPIHHVHHQPQPGVVYIEIMIAPTGRIAIDAKHLDIAGAQILTLLERSDLHTLEITLVDQARETIDLVAADLPPYGLKTFWLYPRGLPEEVHSKKQSARYPLSAEGNSIENEYYRIEASPQDGTLIVTDKLTGVVFPGLNRFIDEGDVGDLYTYCPPEHDTRISTPLEPPKIELVNKGPVRATLRISGRWELPTACTANRSERSSRLTICPIVSEVSLLPGVRRIDIHTIVENRARDHRLRVLFPVSYIVEQVAAEGTFEVHTRPITQSRPTNIAEWAEEPVNTFPQKRFVDLSNGSIGLGVLNRGLPECEIVKSIPGVDLEHNAVALTLLRCVEWLSRGDLATRHGHAGPMEHTPEAQCLGTHEFDYALVPHQGTWEAEDALVLREAQTFNVPLATRAVVAELHEGDLSSQAVSIAVEPPELVLSSLKRSKDGRGTIVRVYNPLECTIEANLHPGFAFQQAYVTNLLEAIKEPIGDVNAQSVQVMIRGGGILTLLFI